MSNMKKTDSLGERTSLRTLAALSLALSLAAFGCSTNQTPGNGEPIYVSPPGGSTAPSSSVTPGTSSGSSIPTTMVSGGVDRSVDAIAVLRANEGYRGKVLGPLNPAPLARSAGSQPMTGQFVSPSLYANPQLTVNTSISSAALPAIGVDGATVALPNVGAVTVGAAIAGGTAAVVATAPLTNARNVVATSTITSAPIRIQRNALGAATVSNVSSPTP